MLVKSNELFLDINGKVVMIDLLFIVVVDLSESVLEFNYFSKNIVMKVGGIGKMIVKVIVVGKVGGIVMKFFKNKKYIEMIGGK